MRWQDNVDFCLFQGEKLAYCSLFPQMVLVNMVNRNWFLPICSIGENISIFSTKDSMVLSGNGNYNPKHNKSKAYDFMAYIHCTCACSAYAVYILTWYLYEMLIFIPNM